MPILSLLLFCFYFHSMIFLIYFTFFRLNYSFIHSYSKAIIKSKKWIRKPDRPTTNHSPFKLSLKDFSKTAKWFVGLEKVKGQRKLFPAPFIRCYFVLMIHSNPISSRIIVMVSLLLQYGLFLNCSASSTVITLYIPVPTP